MPRLDSPLPAERRLSAAGRRLTRLGLASSAAVAIGFGVGYFPRALSRLDDAASSNGALSFSDREIAGGNSIVVDQQAAYQARALIPPHASYRVVTGPHLRNASSLTQSFVASWFTYFLMPRRPAADASWVVCYGCEASALGERYDVVWQDKDGISIGQVR